MSVFSFKKVKRIPVLIIEWDYPFNKKSDGMSFGFVVIKRPGSSKALLIHELKHCEQFFTNPFNSIRSLWNNKIKYENELEAYKAQANYYNVERRDQMNKVYASFLANNYSFSKNLSYNKALQDLRS